MARRRRKDLASERLRTRAGALLTELNTLLVGADLADLRFLLPAVSSTLTHATVRLILEEDVAEEAGRAEAGPALTAREAAIETGWSPGSHTGFSPRYFYEHWAELPFAIKTGPHGARRFSKGGLIAWLRGRNEEAG